jgi:GNAT superfamily N-acetyltransferase
MVSFRPFRDGDAAAVASLLEDAAPPIYRWKLHALHGPGRDKPSRWRTRVAVGPDGGIRGAVTAAHHSVHRGQYVLAVTVAPAHRRQGLGRRLVAEGLRMRTEPLPMIAEFFGRDEASAALVRSAGGEIIQTTPNFVVDPAAMREWADAQPVPPGVVVDDLTAAPAAGLVEAWRDLYLWQHEEWCAPPMSVPAVTAHAEATVAATRRQLSSGAWVDNRLAALAVVVDEPGGGLMLISETTRRNEAYGVDLVAAVVADALRRLAGATAREVALDGHVTDPHLDPVTRTFPPGVRTDPFHVARLS